MKPGCCIQFEISAQQANKNLQNAVHAAQHRKMNRRATQTDFA